MIKALRWSAGRREPPILRDVSGEGEPVEELAAISKLAEFRAERAASAERASLTVEDAMREMETVMATQRELRASANRLLTKLVVSV
jgi:hypothetical protein